MSTQPNDLFDAHVALQKVKALSEACARHGLPMVVIVGLPNDNDADSEVCRASVGMRDPHNRAFMLHKFVEYMRDFETGHVTPNRKLEGD